MNEHNRIAQPRIDPAKTPFTLTATFRRYGITDDPAPSSPEGLYAKSLIQEQGFDGLPHVTFGRELNEYVAAGEEELFRGVSDARFAAQLRTGDFFVGRGGELAGMYAAAGPHALVVARHYAGLGDGTVIRMTLKRGARVMSWHDLEAWVTNLQRSAELPPEVAHSLYNDPGRFAVYLGYDAVRIVDFPDIDNYVVLNQTALRIQEENMR